jgi:nucleoside-diphosphate-sugar epimerase
MENKKYLISGATGFLGKHIVALLSKETFDTIGRGYINTIKFDFTQNHSVLELFNKYEYLVIASGHAHVMQEGRQDAYLHLAVNFKGVQALISAIDTSCLKGVVYISTVAVYGTQSDKPFTEDDELQGDTAYAKSKIAAENYLTEWSLRSNIPILILRIPLIAGKNPPGNLGKMIRAIRNGRYFSILGGKARRSVILAEDLSEFILNNCGKSGIYNLSDGLHPTYRELEVLISKQLNVNYPKGLPRIIAKCLALLGDVFSFIPFNSQKLKKMSQDLIIDDTKARMELGWKPQGVIANFKIQ